jgi:hypothetical protein
MCCVCTPTKLFRLVGCFSCESVSNRRVCLKSRKSAGRVNGTRTGQWNLCTVTVCLRQSAGGGEAWAERERSKSVCVGSVA